MTGRFKQETIAAMARLFLMAEEGGGFIFRKELMESFNLSERRMADLQEKMGLSLRWMTTKREDGGYRIKPDTYFVIRSLLERTRQIRDLEEATEALRRVRRDKEREG